MEYHDKENVAFITMSTARNTNNAAIGGPGLLLNKSSSTFLAKVISYNNRLQGAHFNRNPAFAVTAHEGDNEATTL